MGFGRFVKRLISPEIDQAEDRSAAQASAPGDNSPLPGESDDASPGRPFVTEGELQEAGTGPVAPLAHEIREEEVTRPEPESVPQPEQVPEPEPEQIPESEDEAQIAPEQQPEPEDNPPEPEPEPEPDQDQDQEKPELATAIPPVADEFSLAQSAVNSGFIITLAHELRTPIASLRVSYDLLRDPDTLKGNPGESRRLLGNIDRSIARLERQASDLLDVGYISSGSLNLVKQPLDVTEPLLAAVDISRPAAALRHVAIELELMPDQPSVIADGLRLTQVMTHLLGNAIKFTPVQGSVSITVGTQSPDTGSDAENRQENEEPAPDVLIVRVIDHGPGIREAHFELIFEPFYRISGEGTEGGAGVGLGLAIVKGLIELHDGTVWVKSTPGEATEFGFSIPIT